MIMDDLVAVNVVKTLPSRTYYLCANQFEYQAVWTYTFGQRNKVDLALRLSKLVFPLWVSIERVFDEDGQYADDSILECTV